MRHDPWPRKKFGASLRKIGALSYHHQHPFHVLMNSGKLGRRAIQIWVANRFYYQTNIPIKDAAILSNCPLREVRRAWLHRVMDHDGAKGDEGGIGAWLRLGEACGLSRKELLGHNHVVPGVPRRCLREFRANAAVAGGSGVVADGVVRSGPDGEKVGGIQAVLPVG
jgi:pyrroloquinoline-quinone synthase